MIVKRIARTSAVLLRLTVVVISHADKITDRATIPGGGELPAQSVFIDPKSFAVLPESFPFRTDSFTQFFNPTNSTPPIIQIFNPAFLDILGPNASIREIASNDTFAFAHEAPIYVPETDEVFFASDDGTPAGMSDVNHNNKVFKINLGDVHGNGTVNIPITQIPLPDSIQMTNGGTGPFKGNLIFVNSGRGELAPSLALVNPHPPYNVTVLLNNYYGRQFNSLNDIKVHPPSGKFFFTDQIHGFFHQFRPQPLMPNHVYHFDPDTSAVRVAATDFDHPNGIAFTKDGRTAYVGDTGASRGVLGNDLTRPATLYAFDVDPQTHKFTNRRVLAYIDAGIPDGIQVDTQGNIFTSCADGVQVFAPDGTLLGKFFLGISTASLVFAPPDRLLILARTKVFLVNTAARGVV